MSCGCSCASACCASAAACSCAAASAGAMVAIMAANNAVLLSAYRNANDVTYEKYREFKDDHESLRCKILGHKQGSYSLNVPTTLKNKHDATHIRIDYDWCLRCKTWSYGWFFSKRSDNKEVIEN